MWLKDTEDWNGTDIMNKFVVTYIKDILMGFLMKDGKTYEIRTYEEESLLGNIYVGRVSNIVKNIDAAFVDIENGLSCYYPLEDYKGSKLAVGDMLTVQINKDFIKTKQPTVTTKLSLNGEYVVVHLDETIGISSKIKDNHKRKELKDIFFKAVEDFKDKQKSANVFFGGILRTKSENVSSELIYKEITELLYKLDDIIYKAKYRTAYSCVYEKQPEYLLDIDKFSSMDEEFQVVTDVEDVILKCKEHNILEPRLYEDESISLKSMYSLEGVIEKSLSNRVYLKSGAYLIIEHTEAMTVIDVNSGKAIKGNVKEDKLLSINIEAAVEIARQLRLRNISGIIIVDFINMKQSANDEIILNTLRNAVYEDSVSTIVVDMTKLGLVEITRKRIRKPLYEVLRSRNI